MDLDGDGELLMKCCKHIVEDFTHGDKSRVNELMRANFFPRSEGDMKWTTEEEKWVSDLRTQSRCDRLIKAEYKGYILMLNLMFKGEKEKLPSTQDLMKYPLATSLNKYFDRFAKELQNEHYIKIENYPYDGPETNLIVYCCDAILTDPAYKTSIHDATMSTNFKANWKSRPLALEDRAAYAWYMKLFQSTAQHTNFWSEIKRQGIILLFRNAFRNHRLPSNEDLMKEPAEIALGKYFYEVAKEKRIDISTTAKD